MKRLLVLLVGLSVFLCAGSAFAGEGLIINIPYAQHGGDWWSGLALSNTGREEISVRFYTTHTGNEVQVGHVVTLPPYSQDVRLLPEFFGSYPTENDGRISLRLTASGEHVVNTFKATLFVGSSDGFAFQTYGKNDGEIFTYQDR